MLTNYSEFGFETNIYLDTLTPTQIEMSKRWWYLRGFWSLDPYFCYVYNKRKSPKQIVKKYPIHKCEDIDARHRVFKQAMDFIVSDILRYDPFK